MSRKPVSATLTRVPGAGSQRRRPAQIASNTVSASTKRSSRKPKAEACASPHLAKIAPPLHSSTNKEVEPWAARIPVERHEFLPVDE